MKKLKVFTMVLLSFAMFFSLAPQTLALNTITDAEQVVPFYLGTTTTHSWSYQIVNTYDETVGNWTHFATSSKATRDGETDTVSNTVEYSHTFSGSFGGNIKKLVEAQLGYTFGKSVSWSISKTSAPLKKGEYVKAYYIKNYSVSNIKQTDTMRTTGFEQIGGGQYVPVDRVTTAISYVDAKKALLPKIKLEYWKDNKLLRSFNSGSVLEKTEYYEYIDGAYCLAAR